ncbi:hypothetical protein F4811DRAFT_534459 [Daldinia bambusicola]|nr:hypothetical protein F4811DRAFT_534459 [Daldinia bambusicola]
MVYLIVEDIALVGWNNTLVDTVPVESADTGAEVPQDQTKDKPPAPITSKPVLDSHNPQPFDSGVGLLEELADADDDFEAIPNAVSKATQNRMDLAGKSKGGNTLPWLSNDPGKPVKLTKLRSIPNLPYKQNWSVNVLAVVSAISGLEPSGLPPYSQRQARLADPSTDKHVLLTVFLDPEQFTPAVGSVVLLLGVKNHRFDGGSLKKYESDRSTAGNSWWYENPTQFEWCDVEGLRRWWAESQFC